MQASCDEGFESLRPWTWNDHLAVDPLGVTDIELKCVNSTKVTHALNQHEPDSGRLKMFFQIKSIVNDIPIVVQDQQIGVRVPGTPPAVAHLTR